MKETMPLWAWLVCFTVFFIMGGILYLIYKLQTYLQKRKGPDKDA